MINSSAQLGKEEIQPTAHYSLAEKHRVARVKSLLAMQRDEKSTPITLHTRGNGQTTVIRVQCRGNPKSCLRCVVYATRRGRSRWTGAEVVSDNSGKKRLPIGVVGAGKCIYIYQGECMCVREVARAHAKCVPRGTCYGRRGLLEKRRRFL